jgi:phage tail-like protein
MAGQVKFARANLGNTKNQGDYTLTSTFTIEIEGVTVGGVHKIEGLDDEHEILEYADGEEHNKRTRPGRQRLNTITIERDWSSTNEFYNWFKTVIDGKVERKSVSIILNNDAGAESGRINLFSVWPKKWGVRGINARSSGHASEILELVYERRTLA